MESPKAKQLNVTPPKLDGVDLMDIATPVPLKRQRKGPPEAIASSVIPTEQQLKKRKTMVDKASSSDATQSKTNKTSKSKNAKTNKTNKTNKTGKSKTKHATKSTKSNAHISAEPNHIMKLHWKEGYVNTEGKSCTREIFAVVDIVERKDSGDAKDKGLEELTIRFGATQFTFEKTEDVKSISIEGETPKQKARREKKETKKKMAARENAAKDKCERINASATKSYGPLKQGGSSPNRRAHYNTAWSRLLVMPVTVTIKVPVVSVSVTVATQDDPSCKKVTKVNKVTMDAFKSEVRKQFHKGMCNWDAQSISWDWILEVAKRHAKTERTEKTEKAPKTEKTEKAPKTERTERTEKTE